MGLEELVGNAETVFRELLMPSDRCLVSGPGNLLAFVSPLFKSALGVREALSS